MGAYACAYACSYRNHTPQTIAVGRNLAEISKHDVARLGLSGRRANSGCRDSTCPSSEIWRHRAAQVKGGSGASEDEAMRPAVMLQAAIGDGLAFDPFSFAAGWPGRVRSRRRLGFDYRCSRGNGDGCSRLDESLDLVVRDRQAGKQLFQEDAVLQCLVPALDLALGSWGGMAHRGRGPSRGASAISPSCPRCRRSRCLTAASADGAPWRAMR